MTEMDRRLGVTGWARVNADGSMERVDVDEARLVYRYGTGWRDLSNEQEGMPFTWSFNVQPVANMPLFWDPYRPRPRLAPRWQVPAIKRRRGT